MRLLMIAPYFPPRQRVGAQRPYRFARGLPALGVEPCVVHLRSALPGAPALRRIELLAPMDRTEGSGGAGKRGGAGAWLDARTPVDSWWPVLMAQSGRVIREARRFAPDLVWSTADPWSSHALARRVARALDLPWIADYRDPWSLCRVRTRGRPAWVRRIDARVERGYLEAATLSTFTSARTTERYRAAYPGLAARFHTLENGFDPDAYGVPLPRESTPRAVHPRPELVLTFFGRFRALSSAARAISTLEALRALDPTAKVVVRCAGGLDPDDQARARAAGVLTSFEAYAPVGGAEALHCLANSDLLWLSSEQGRDEIIPAKLFDYLAAARPILSLCENPDVADILARTGAGAQFDSPAQAARCLLACVQAKQRGAPLPLAIAGSLEARDAWAAPALTARLVQLIDAARSAKVR